MRIIAKAPTRIDLAGGTLDIWPLYLFHEETITINVAIDLYATVILDPRKDRRIALVSVDQQSRQEAETITSLQKTGDLSLLARLVHHFEPSFGFLLKTESTVPAGSGLGGSSALAIAVAGALNEFTKRGYAKDDLIRAARDTEAQVLGIPTGEQDYYAAVYGGLSAWHFGVHHTTRSKFAIPLNDLQNRLLLLYTGRPRNSGINNWEVFKNRIDRHDSVIAYLNEIKKATLSLSDALHQQNWKDAYLAIEAEWEARKKLAPGITTPEIERIISVGKEHGARAAKVCGAGGGGCLILLTEPENRAVLCNLLKEQGETVLDFHLVENGVSIEINREDAES